MKLRCKPGDLAVILHEIPACAENIGRIVTVRGPVLYNTRYKHHSWLIKPVHPALWWVDRSNRICLERVTWLSQVEHPDAWMLPIRPEDLDRFGEDAARDLDLFLEKVNTAPALQSLGGELEKIRR